MKAGRLNKDTELISVDALFMHCDAVIPLDSETASGIP